MADDAAGNPSPEDPDATPPAAPRKEDASAPARPSRPKESWEPQVRELRRPDFAPRLAKTSDLPTEIPKERQKSKLGKHRAAAIHWEEEVESDKDEAEEDGTEGPGGAKSADPSGLSRGQVLTLAGLGLAVTVLGSVWFAKNLLVGDGAPPPPRTGMGAMEAADAAVVTLTPEEHAQTTEVMRRFLEALKVEDLRPLLREPDRVWPLVEEYQRRTPWKPHLVRRLPSLSEVQLNRDLLAGVAEVDDYQRLVIAMQRTPQGIKVDWESFTGQGEMPWDEFLATRPTAPVLMRVSLQPDDYYNRDFPDPTTHACYRLSARGETPVLYGYAPRGLPVHAQLASRTRINPRTMPTVRLRFPPGATGLDQVEITELVADGWLVSESSRVKIDAPGTPAPGTPETTSTPAPAPGTPAPGTPQ